jgi:isocitrate dehydrogenase
MRRVAGVDVFVEFGGSPDELGTAVERLVADSPLALKIVDNRGTRVYPATGTPTDCVDAWRCRFVVRDSSGELSDSDLLTLLSRMAESHRFTHVEKLHEFDGVPGFSKAQGED